MSENDFASRLAAATPTPGGGAAAARVGLFATSLLRMAASITLSKTTPEEKSTETALAAVREVSERAAHLGDEFRRLEEADIEAFENYLSSLRLPKTTPQEKSRRQRARLDAARRATEVPLATLETALQTMALCRRLQELGSTLRLRAESDVGGALELAHAAFRAAELNVRSNLPTLEDSERVRLQGRFKECVSQLEHDYPRLRRAMLTWLESPQKK